MTEKREWRVGWFNPRWRRKHGPNFRLFQTRTGAHNFSCEMIALGHNVTVESRVVADWVSA